ncbi:DNA mismatch repair endonuclease MutL [Flavobacteriaceae bacterium]|nr:DNA mismatch repair endonuclease MutL [Flavobacteriaceae bacterium]MDA9015823.1 DNA mismatch repair endonuclease MutL [Flavobacteriaceae bacterium]
MSAKISLLPDHVANQIAAGEVIQRPASVVKELLENAVDAQATTIQLVIKNAGKTLVQVIDDGQGMSNTDLRLAFERHATSKINVAEDLFGLTTKGFRGEALASIAAIAHVETHTRTYKDDVSHSLRIEGSKVVDQSLSTQPQGTSIAVKSLFYNIPARRNFLKSDQVELRHVIDEFHRVALAHPEIKFLFFNNGNELFDLAVSGLKLRISGVFGTKWESQLVPVEELTSLAEIKGFVVKPDFAKKTRGQQFFFVNNRFIKSSFLHHAVSAAFEGLLRPGYQPGYFLYLQVDPKSIDINIHPTKTEVKFEEEQNLYAILRAAVKHSLGIFQVMPTLDFEQNKSMEVPYAFKDKSAVLPPIEVDSNFNPFKNDSNTFSSKKDPQWEGLYSGLQDKEIPSINPSQESLMDISESPKVFQLFSKYIVCPLKTHMLVIDQRRAHQRVLYERFLNAITNKKGVSQQLLFPLELKLNPQQLDQFQYVEAALEMLGFQMSLNNEKILVIKGAPDHCQASKIEGVIDAILSEHEEESSLEHFSHADQVAKTMAKSLAIKSGEHMDVQEQQALLDDFFGCKETAVSPFNQQIFITLEKTEIEQKLN